MLEVGKVRQMVLGKGRGLGDAHLQQYSQSVVTVVAGAAVHGHRMMEM